MARRHQAQKSSTFMHDGGCVKTCLVTFLMGAAVYFAVKSIQKYREAKISVCSHRQPSVDNRIAYPSITVCSGFRNEAIKPFNVAREYIESNMDVMEILGPEVVKNMSFSRTEHLTYFTQAAGDQWDNNYLLEDELWTEEFHEFYGGRCATFSPKNLTKPGETNAIMIGFRWPERTNIYRCNSQVTDFCYQHAAVFLHPPNGFIYNKGNKFLGQTLLYPTENEKTTYTLAKKRIVKLNKDYEECNPGTSIVEWKQCILDEFEKKAQCTFPWLVNSKTLRYPVCSVSQVVKRMSSLEHHTWWDIDDLPVRETNCKRPCSFTEYEIRHVPSVFPFAPGTWVFSNDTIAVLSLFFVDTVTETIEEFIAYDGFNLLGEMGGTFGFFLGVSAVQMIQDFSRATRRILSKQNVKPFWRHKENVKIDSVKWEKN